MERLYINGEWVAGHSGKAIPVLNPATEEVLAEVPRGDAVDAARAVAAAQAAFDDWRWTPGVERAEMLHEAARCVRQHFDEIVHLLTLEQGKPLPEQEEEVEWVAGTLDYYAGLARTYRGRLLAPADRQQFNFVMKEPLGVAACIVPFNYPLLLMAWKVAPALAAGNTVVVKPAEQTPLSTLRIAQLAFAHFPAGVVNVVTGTGEEAGEPLVVHPDVPMIAFTGSTAVGQRIARLAADHMKRTHLELGGKDAFVIAPDADVESAIEAVTYEALLNAGQVCTATERVYVPQFMHDAFANGIADYVRELRLGPGIERDTDMGPMADAKYREKVEQHVVDAVDNGARILAGGKRPARLGRGYYYEP
ncbi:MAG TPA: aldehyde dehydrogenase family protein, partial [Candidatus Binatia bacterium]|nr:aldehyde dehydrogenase family protein [Candidatus Binatia bacterium]